MHSTLATISLSLAYLSVPALAQLPYPVVQPPYDWATQEPQLKAVLTPKAAVSVRAWPAGSTPSTCFQGFGLSGVSGEENILLAPIDPKEVKVMDVTFDDCDTPWVLCNHQRSGISDDALIAAISRMPVGMREAVGNFVAIPENWQKVDGSFPIAWAQPDSPTIVFQEAAYWGSPGTLAHEIFHVLDEWVFNPSPGNGYFSEGASWSQALARDGVVPTLYAKGNVVEDFAEVGRASLFDRNVPGGLSGVGANAAAIKAQLDLMRTTAGDRNVKAGRCTASKTPSSPPVDTTKALSGMAAANLAAADELVEPHYLSADYPAGLI